MLRDALFPRAHLSRLRFRGGPLAFLVFLVMCLLYPISLQQAEWIETSAQLPQLAVVALLLGLLVGNGPMRRRAATYFGATAGAIATVVLTIAATPPVEAPLRDRAVRMAIHVNDWITQVVKGEAASDPSVFVLFLGATVWGAVYVGSFLLAREKRPHEAILFTGTCLVINVSLALTPLSGDLVLFSLCALVLLVRLHIVSLEERWKRENIQPSGEMSLRVLGGGVTWTLIFVLLALFTPRVGATETLSSAFNTFEAPYHRVESEWQRFFAGVTGPSRLKGVSFSDSMRLGQVPNLSSEVVFTVQTDSARFWRVITYDFYTGAGWRITETDRVDRVVPPTTARIRLDATFDVTQAHGNLLYGANEPVRVDVPYQFTGGPDRSYSTSLRAVNRFQAAGIYTVSSLVSNATKVQLRRATTVYPDEIRSRYLQVPSSLPQRVRDLAQRISGTQATAYDKAEALESYLRDRYRYSTAVRSAPTGRDPIDYFLFDLKEDFCEYFASAMVIMLRDLGIPARLVEGFTAGTFEPSLGQYVVRQQNAHAWVEAYFPQYGWIEFEPTPSEQPFGRIDDVAPDPVTPASDGGADSGAMVEDPALGLEDFFLGTDPGEFTAFVEERIDPRPFLSVLAALLLGLALVYARFQLRFRGAAPIDAAWGKTQLLGAYAGVPHRPSQTAYEYADVLGRAEPRIAGEVRDIARARVIEIYTAGGASGEEQSRASDNWSTVAKVLIQRLPRRVLEAARRLLPV